MSKKIIVLNGSPRIKGNTAALVREFTKGAEANGNEVVCFNLQRMDIQACLGCYRGGEDPDSPCVQKDDMEQIYPVYREADIIVLASPLYFWNISGQLKCALDRLFAIAEADGNYRSPEKSSILLMAAESNDYEETIYYYDRLTDHLGWTNLGKVLVGGVMNAGDIEGRPELLEAEKLGQSIT